MTGPSAPRQRVVRALCGRLRRMAAAPRGASLRRPQALAGLVLEDQPGARVRRRPFTTGQVFLPPPGDRALVPLGGPAAPGPARSSPGGAAAHPSRPACTPPPNRLRDPGQRPALIQIADGRRARVQHRLQLAQLDGSELALRAARPLGGQRRPAARGQRPPPPVHRHPRHPEPPGDLPVAGSLSFGVSIGMPPSVQPRRL